MPFRSRFQTICGINGFILMIAKIWDPFIRYVEVKETNINTPPHDWMLKRVVLDAGGDSDNGRNYTG